MSVITTNNKIDHRPLASNSQWVKMGSSGSLKFKDISIAPNGSIILGLTAKGGLHRWEPSTESWVSAHGKGTDDFPHCETISALRTDECLFFNGAKSPIRMFIDPDVYSAKEQADMNFFIGAKAGADLQSVDAISFEWTLAATTSGSLVKLEPNKDPQTVYTPGGGSPGITDISVGDDFAVALLQSHASLLQAKGTLSTLYPRGAQYVVGKSVTPSVIHPITQVRAGLKDEALFLSNGVLSRHHFATDLTELIPGSGVGRFDVSFAGRLVALDATGTPYLYGDSAALSEEPRFSDFDFKYGIWSKVTERGGYNQVSCGSENNVMAIWGPGGKELGWVEQWEKFGAQKLQSISVAPSADSLLGIDSAGVLYSSPGTDDWKKVSDHIMQAVAVDRFSFLALTAAGWVPPNGSAADGTASAGTILHYENGEVSSGHGGFRKIAAADARKVWGIDTQGRCAKIIEGNKEVILDPAYHFDHALNNVPESEQTGRQWLDLAVTEDGDVLILSGPKNAGATGPANNRCLYRLNPNVVTSGTPAYVGEGQLMPIAQGTNDLAQIAFLADGALWGRTSSGRIGQFLDAEWQFLPDSGFTDFSMYDRTGLWSVDADGGVFSYQPGFAALTDAGGFTSISAGIFGNRWYSENGLILQTNTSGDPVPTNNAYKSRMYHGASTMSITGNQPDTGQWVAGMEQEYACKVAGGKVYEFFNKHVETGWVWSELADKNHPDFVFEKVSMGQERTIAGITGGPTGGLYLWDASRMDGQWYPATGFTPPGGQVSDISMVDSDSGYLIAAEKPYRFKDRVGVSRLPGQFKSIAGAVDGTVYAVDLAGDIYQRAKLWRRCSFGIEWQGATWLLAANPTTGLCEWKESGGRDQYTHWDVYLLGHRLADQAGTHDGAVEVALYQPATDALLGVEMTPRQIPQKGIDPADLGTPGFDPLDPKNLKELPPLVVKEPADQTLVGNEIPLRFGAANYERATWDTVFSFHIANRNTHGIPSEGALIHNGSGLHLLSAGEGYLPASLGPRSVHGALITLTELSA